MNFKIICRVSPPNKLAVVVCMLGLFWCGVAAIMIVLYTQLVVERGHQERHKVLIKFNLLKDWTKRSKVICPIAKQCHLLFYAPACRTAAVGHIAFCRDVTSVHIPFERPPPKKSPCIGFFCPFHASCFINETSGAPYCACLDDCSDHIISPVCGSDGKTYDNECKLQLHSCQWQRRITVEHHGKCIDPCDGVKCEGQQVCKLNQERVAVCQCEVSCDQTVAPVCGSDGMTYSNECMLRQKACLENRDITVQYPAECRESQEPCRGVTCEYDAICVTRNGKPTCECPDCKDAYYDPVCGDNGIHYENLCKLHKENCEKRKKVMVEHRGLCNIGGCEKNNTVCQYYSLCESDGVTSRCVCPDHCEKTDDSVCGTDGLTYASECEMRVASCKQQVYIYIMTFGPCKTCNGVKCKYGAKCTNGKCVCPFLCPAQYEPVCASDGETYSNDCEMKRTACKKDEELEIVHQGECEDYLSSVGSGEGSGDLEDCDEASCRFGGMCKHGQDGGYRCHCSFSCDAIRSPVCGSDGVTYGNPCELQTASCEQQRPIVVQFQGACDDMDEVLCDGMSPVIDPSTGREYQCTKGSDCPYDSYCHAQFGKCCQEERLSDSNIRDCTESVFGCCRDQMTFAPGPNYSGCPDECHCNWIGTIAGAFGNTCDPVTKQCKCKPGVGGLKCDSCYPGYWGLHLIQEKGNPGCTPCNCNKIGSTREDCHQMIGKCECRDGYEGMKCERCSGSQAPIGSNGCMGQTPLPKSKKTTRHIHFDNVMPNTASKKPGSTPRPPDEYDPNMKYGRIGDICLEHSYCTIPHSHCKLAICNCDKGYIPTKENTECSAVIQSPGSGSVLPEGDDFNQCTVNPCLNQGVCELDDNLGYRCLCPLGRTGVICKQTSFFKTPSFSGESYLVLQPLGNISGDFYLDIAFHTMNRDGILLFASEKPDGTGQFISLAISDGQVEFKFDMGKGPVQIRHPQKLSQNTYHQVIAKRLGQTAMLIVDGAEQMAVMIPNSRSYIELSGDLYLGYLPKNLTFIQEKIGISLGIVGCIESLTARYMNFTRNYKLQFPSPDIIDGLDIVPCERNPCQSIPCMNQGTCLVLGTDLFECVCPKGYTGSTCDSAVDLCTHSPCHESATCGISGLGEVTCFCPEGRQGQFCEYEKLKEVVVPQFTGDSYMLIPLHSSLAKQMSIEVWFMSQTPNGMLLFATQYLSGQGDFLSLNIVDKYLEFRFDLGDGPVFIRSSQPIKVGGWHKALIQTKYQEGSLILDNGEPVKASSQGVLKELQLSGILYLGGYKNISDVPTDSNIQKNFTGALQRIYISGRQIEDLKKEAVERYHVEEYHGQPCNINPCLNGGVCVPALEKVDCRCPRQYFGKNCERVAENLEMNKPVRFDGKTYLQYFNEISEMQEAQKTNKVKLKFRTHHSNGMLLYQGRGQPASDYLTLSIVNSQVELSFNLGTWNQDSLFILRSTVYVSDGSWHSVTAERDKQYATLQVDRESPVSATAEGASTQLDTDGMLWIGGKPNLPRSLPREYSKAFKGCLGDVFIDNNELNLFKHRKGQSNTIEFCH